MKSQVKSVEKPKIEEEKRQPKADPIAQMAALQKTAFGGLTQSVQKSVTKKAELAKETLKVQSKV